MGSTEGGTEVGTELGTKFVDDHDGLGGGDDGNYGGDCVLPMQRRSEEYSLKGRRPPADPGGLISTKLRGRR